LHEEAFFGKKINDLVMIDNYARINRMGSAEARTDLCNECLQKIDNAWDRMTKNQTVFLEAEAPSSVKACGPYDGMLALGATVLAQGSVLWSKHDVQTRLKKMTLIPRDQVAQKKDEAMLGGQRS
jgi:hypothetical protein